MIKKLTHIVINSPFSYQFALILAFSIAALSRILPVMQADFPLNDGGFFYHMIKEIQAHNYRLPAFSDYNLNSIPFAYPPLSFYLTGLISDIFSIPLLTVMRFLPAIASIGSAIAFFYLARNLLSSRLDVVCSLFCFVCMYRGFVWQIMGAGISRSIGLLLAIISLNLLYAALHNHRMFYIAGAAVLGACAFCAHMAAGLFWAAACLLFFLLLEPTRKKFAVFLQIVALSAALSSIWWLNVIYTHGLEPFQSASRTVTSVLKTGTDIHSFFKYVTHELQRTWHTPFLPLFGFLAAIGTIQAISKRKYLPLFLWLLPPLLDGRQGFQYAVVGLSLVCGLGIANGIIPALRSQSSKQLRLVTVLSILLVYGLIAAFRFSIDGREKDFAAINAQERSVINWLADNLPPGSRILVIEPHAWWHGRFSEWLPALTPHRVVHTVQGTEWLANNQFQHFNSASISLQFCLRQNLSCIISWSKRYKMSFDYIFIPQSSRTVAPSLIADINRCENCENIHSSGGGAVIRYSSE